MSTTSPAAFLTALWSPAPAGSWGEIRAYKKRVREQGESSPPPPERAAPDRPGRRTSRARAVSVRLPFQPAGFARALAWASKLNREGWHIAHGVQPRTRRASGSNVGRSRDVDCFVALPLDFDDLDAAELAVARLVAAGVPPSAIVASGRGQHVYLFLASAVPASDAEPVASRLCHWLGSDPTADPPRVMRLPGTLNPKPEAGGHVAAVEVFEPERRYALAQVTAALDSAGAPADLPLPNRPGAGAGRVVAPAPAARPVTHQRRDELVAALSPPMRRLLEYGDHAGAGHGTRSHGSLAVARALQKAGASEEEIVSVLLASPAGEEVREKGQRRLDRIMELLRWPPPEKAASLAKVLVVERCGDGRVDLRLEVVEGEHLGRCLWQHIAPGPDLWRYVRAAAGLEPCPTAEAIAEALPLGAIVRVRLDEVTYLGDRRVQVRLWLPARRRGGDAGGREHADHPLGGDRL